jgi:hypothetical protein
MKKVKKIHFSNVQLKNIIKNINLLKRKGKTSLIILNEHWCETIVQLCEQADNN